MKDEQTPGGVTETLNREEAGRRASEEGAERFRPGSEETMTVQSIPTGFGLEGAGSNPTQKYASVDTTEVAEVGGMGEYRELHNPADLIECNDENIGEVQWMWLKIYGEECPYDFTDLHDKDMMYQMALDDLERGWGIEVADQEGPVQVKFDWRGLSNERVRGFLKANGDEKFVERVWTDCTQIVLLEPDQENPGWGLGIEGKWNKDEGRLDALVLSLSDFEASLKTDNSRPIRLPSLGDGARSKRLDFVNALHDLRIDGIALPPVVDVDLRMRRKKAGRR